MPDDGLVAAGDLEQQVRVAGMGRAQAHQVPARQVVSDPPDQVELAAKPKLVSLERLLATVVIVGLERVLLRRRCPTYTASSGGPRGACSNPVDWVMAPPGAAGPSLRWGPVGPGPQQAWREDRAPDGSDRYQEAGGRLPGGCGLRVLESTGGPGRSLGKKGAGNSQAVRELEGPSGGESRGRAISVRFFVIGLAQVSQPVDRSSSRSAPRRVGSAQGNPLS